ncbi:hypothetical protein QYE76_002375 [Lolium multiflorum]|uniref:Uncharacterized protein n=1 Tax=Lolium multiflorum TaxID=4521 RepID=A0AAD8RNF6_LOLMU|nr:hypothetical protein QYE76_002375 [Lolium multiflorum]
MTRARVKALHDKVNSLLTSLDLDTPLDGMLPHAETLCVIRYVEHQDHGEDDTPWSREGEEQLIEKMYTELDPKSPQERKEETMSGQSRIRSDRPPDRATRPRIRSTGRLTGPPGPQPGHQPVPSGRHPGAPEPRPVTARSRIRSPTDWYVEHQDHGEDGTSWSREGEEQLIEKMYTELDPKSPEERKEEKADGPSRTRSTGS